MHGGKYLEGGWYACEGCYVYMDLFAYNLPVDVCVEARSQLQISSILFSTCMQHLKVMHCSQVSCSFWEQGGFPL